MQPPFNSFPSQFSDQSNNSNPSFHPLGFPANPSLPDLCSLLQGSMPVQPQMGPFNPQIPLPFNNPSFPMPNMAALIAQQPALLNQIGMALQNRSNSLNPISMFMNQLNLCQPQGQPFPANFSNFPQQLNPNMGYPDLQNLIYNLNSVMPTQFSNPSQFVGPQRPNFFPNPPFVAGGQEANANQKNLGEEKRINQMPQTHHSRNSSPFRNQGKPFNSGKNSSSTTSNSKNFPRKDFRKNMKYQKSQFPHINNGKRKFEISDEHKGTGFGYERTAKSGRSDSAEQAKERKRSFALTYTEQEIILWREERKKNYPSNANIKKKHSETKTNSEVNNEEAKLRRARLKEILAKQAELGVEVAEIPSRYLLDSAEQVNDKEDNRTTSFRRRERFGKKHDKRGRRNKRDRFAKRQTSAKMDPSSKSSVNKREQTLLQKLLSADVKRDKQNLLQVFRFMVANKFFKDFPEKSLKFPQIVVKEEVEKNRAGSEKSQLSRKEFSEIGNNRRSENAEAKSQTCYGEGKCNLEMNRIVEEQEEEGEIIN